jgi:hypothetical protein
MYATYSRPNLGILDLEGTKLRAVPARAPFEEERQ